MTHPVKGIHLTGTHCGLKPDGKPDIALIVSDQPCTAAGVFTTNQIKAASVRHNQRVLAHPDARIRAVLVNTGSANACTGPQGDADAQTNADQVAAALGCDPDEVLVMSTGVIGLPLPMDRMTAGISALAGNTSPDGWLDAATAIMTTDTRPKVASMQTGAGYTITGIAKGSGMIAPNMATMLSVIATDAAVPRDMLQTALRTAADRSFNRIVVDGDMSTNDTVLALANGASGITVQDKDAFTAALTEVCIQLAQAIVRDGEGATKFVTIKITGAADEAAARAVANKIAASALVKTAFYGADPNWGRILCAAGYSGAAFDPATTALWLLDADGSPAIQLVDGGTPLDYNEPAAIALMQTPEWGFRLDLGAGDAAYWVWTCDLSHEYVTINGHYRT